MSTAMTRASAGGLAQAHRSDRGRRLRRHAPFRPVGPRLVHVGMLGALIFIGLLAIGFGYVYNRREQKRRSGIVA